MKKMVNDSLNIRGDLSIKMHRKSGGTEVYDFTNTVVTLGKQLLIKRLLSDQMTSDITITGFQWQAQVATLTFDAQIINRFPKGMEITIVDQSNTEFNTQYTVLSSSLTQITIQTPIQTQPTTIGKIASLDNNVLVDMRFGGSQTAQSISNVNLLQPLPNNQIFDNTSASMQYLTQETDFTSTAQIYYLGFFDDATGFPDGVTTGSCTIAEAAIFNNSVENSGVMFCRQVFPPIIKNYGDTMEILWRISIT